MAGTDHFRFLEPRWIIVIILPDVGVGDVDFEFAFENSFGGGALGPLGQHLFARRAHEFQLSVERLLRAEAGLGFLESFFGQRFAGGGVGLGGFGAEELDLDHLLQHLAFHHGRLLGGDVLAAAGGLRFDANDFVVQLAAGDFESLALSYSFIAEKLRRPERGLGYGGGVGGGRLAGRGATSGERCRDEQQDD